MFSWMTKLLVIFLEVVPVVAKMFFSPPSVYAARIQAEVKRQSERARQDSEEPTAEPRIADLAPPEPDPAELPARGERGRRSAAHADEKIGIAEFDFAQRSTPSEVQQLKKDLEAPIVPRERDLITRS